LGRPQLATSQLGSSIESAQQILLQKEQTANTKFIGQDLKVRGKNLLGFIAEL
jgi:hypothetical protein